MENNNHVTNQVVPFPKQVDEALQAPMVTLTAEQLELITGFKCDDITVSIDRSWLEMMQYKF